MEHSSSFYINNTIRFVPNIVPFYYSTMIHVDEPLHITNNQVYIYMQTTLYLQNLLYLVVFVILYPSFCVIINSLFEAYSLNFGIYLIFYINIELMSWHEKRHHYYLTCHAV